jgi:hypothetical protein
MLFQRRAPQDEQLTRQDLADRRVRRAVGLNVVITALAAIAVSWTIRHGASMPTYTDALVLGVMFGCTAFGAAYQYLELRRGRGSLTYFRGMAAFTAMTAIEFAAQLSEGNLKFALLIAGLVPGIPGLYLMLRAYDELRAKNAD